MGLAWREEVNALAAPAQLQREGAHRDPKLGGQVSQTYPLTSKIPSG